MKVGGLNEVTDPRTARLLLPFRLFHLRLESESHGANTPDVSFIVYGSTSPSLAFSQWQALTGLSEAAPGQYRFTDTQAANGTRCFYRVRSP